MSGLALVQIVAGGREYSTLPMAARNARALFDRLHNHVRQLFGTEGMIRIEDQPGIDRLVLRARDISSIELIRTEDPGL